VHVVIVGLGKAMEGTKRLLTTVDSVTVEDQVPNINPYLVAAPTLVVMPRRAPFFGIVPRAAKGSKPTDGGFLLVEPDEVDEVEADPIALKYLHPATGARVMLHGEDRYCLWLAGVDPGDVRRSPVIKERLRKVREFRLSSRNARTQKLADRPGEFDVNAQPEQAYLCLPCHSSENRRTIPMAFYDKETIVLDSAISIAGAEIWLFALLESSMFTAWLSAVGGRLKSDYRIAPDLVYNTFPHPDLTDVAKRKLTIAGNGVLAARASHPSDSLADLYDPIAMPSDLVKAHDALDKVVDTMFAPRKKFRTDADRLSVLFERYEMLSAPLSAGK
jgi:hypothetical protein